MRIAAESLFVADQQMIDRLESGERVCVSERVSNSASAESSLQ